MADILQPGVLANIIGNNLHPERIRNLETFLNSICPTYGIVDADIMHEFLANVLEESNCFSRYEENLNYTAKRLTEVWPSRFPNLDSAIPYEHDSRKLANKVYGDRKDLGNVQPGDGFTFRGSGPIQITGRSNFTIFAAYIRKRFNIIMPLDILADKLRTDDALGIHSACWLFAIAKQLIDEAINDNMPVIVKRINGGLNGYKERLKYYELCKQLIK